MSKLRLKQLRNKRGALLVEHASVFYLVFLLVFFPFLNCSVLGFRTFFLNFAANQSAIHAAKAKTYFKAVETSPGTYSPSACELARESADKIKRILPGIDWKQTENNPDVQIVCKPINPFLEGICPVKVFSRGHGAPLDGENTPDQSTNVYLCRVVIKGQVMPLVCLPWCKFPGISCPLDVTVSSDALYENPAGLTM